MIVSLFGDLAQHDGDHISGVALTEIAGLMGIRAEAIRVALHRLRKEGWVDSIREGRSSQHQLTQRGRKDTVSATPRIYARARTTTQHWNIVGASSDTGLEPVLREVTSAVELSRRFALIPSDDMDLPKDLMVFAITPKTVPHWMQSSVCPQDLADAALALEHALTQTNAMISAAGTFDPVQRAALRTLTVHRWRKIVLRIPNLPDMFFPPNWRGEACRDLTFDLLDQLPAPTLAELEASALQRR
ncbi:PaaX family transcriptional regulator C-terminal domain-containing protein [Halocynthiibacter namhaensis]|uniref:PaaX family transcriptional regulator C-terminal domain-containing protein n=1 Tax=Halocynthiibacter namhaensis TaxID=1290553 RepID=UPI00138E4D38|nr:PaaX family transcriptional regulator C-terminal domain-containing protein [Halocynthiibacter namhaensis]